MSERITWIVCSRCGNRAAAGWAAGQLVEFDCLSAGHLTELELRRVQTEGQRPVRGA